MPLRPPKNRWQQSQCTRLATASLKADSRKPVLAFRLRPFRPAREKWENIDWMTLQELRRTSRDSVLRLAAKHGAYNVRVFGSIARGDSSPQSDVDFLVDLEPGRTLSDLGGLLMDLQEVLGAPVDVATVGGLRARVRERVLAEAVPL